MGILTPSVRGQARGLYRAATMLCPKLDIFTVAWHTLALARGHRPRLPALSSLRHAVQSLGSSDHAETLMFGSRWRLARGTALGCSVFPFYSSIQPIKPDCEAL